MTTRTIHLIDGTSTTVTDEIDRFTPLYCLNCAGRITGKVQQSYRARLKRMIPKRVPTGPFCARNCCDLFNAKIDKTKRDT